MIPLSQETRDRLERVFAPDLREQAERLLAEECADNLRYHVETTPESCDRIRFAVLKLSQGRLSELKKWINDAKFDWRDVLVAAGFGNDTTEHERWNP